MSSLHKDGSDCSGKGQYGIGCEHIEHKGPRYILKKREIPVPRSHPAYIIYYRWYKKLDALKAYGGDQPACICCGETNPQHLGFDHMSSKDAGYHRTKIAKYNLINWLGNNGYPPGFQILCNFCNISKGTKNKECLFHKYDIH